MGHTQQRVVVFFAFFLRREVIHFHIRESLRGRTRKIHNKRKLFFRCEIFR